MAALTMTQPVTTGAAVTINAASASDTITQTQLGTQGINLIAITTGTICTITISDAGTSPAGNPATTSGVATAATGAKAFFISPSQVNLGTGLVTIGASPATGLTYHVFPA
jgi:hypothetical protein